MTTPLKALSQNEHLRLQKCEQRIEWGLKTFIEVGETLLEIGVVCT